MYGKIRLDFEIIKKKYITYSRLGKKDLQAADIDRILGYLNDESHLKARNGVKATPCCMQVSEALNQCGPEHKLGVRSHKRPNEPTKSGYYALDVADLESHLTMTYGHGEEIKKDSGENASTLKSRITGRNGLLLFRDADDGAHTEFWDGSDIFQNGVRHDSSGKKLPYTDISIMSPAITWPQQRVVFWEIVSGKDLPVPEWLVGWWEVDNGSIFYYHFSRAGEVSWTNVKPLGPHHLPNKGPVNEGIAVMLPTWPVSFSLIWKSFLGKTTQESFVVSSSAFPIRMVGVSNHGPKLSARRMHSDKKGNFV